MNFLSDNWKMTGDTLPDFKDALKQLTEQTEIKPCKMDTFHFLSMHDIGISHAIFPLHANTLWKKGKASYSLPKFEMDTSELIDTLGYDTDVATEALTNGLFCKVDKVRTRRIGLAQVKKNITDYLPVSALAMTSVSNRIHVNGLTRNLVRDLMIASNFDKPIPVYAITRTDKDTGKSKVFAIMSEKYRSITQETIVTIIDKLMEDAKAELGEATCAGWSIDHSLTRLYMEFPDFADEISKTYSLPKKMIPGLMFETSDIGECAFRIAGYFKVDSYIHFIGSEYSQIHVGDIDEEKIVKNAYDNIFPEFRQYPERLAEFMMIDLTEASMSEEEKKKTMSEIYKAVSKHVDLLGVLRKKRESSLIEQMVEEVNPELDYTAYDVAMDFLTLSKRIDTDNDNLREAIAKSVKKIMTFDFNALKSHRSGRLEVVETADDDSILLLA